MRWKLKINSLFLLLWQKLHSSKFPGTKELLISSCTLYSYCFGQTELVHPIPVNTVSRTFSTRKFDLKTGNSKRKVCGLFWSKCTLDMTITTWLQTCLQI